MVCDQCCQETVLAEYSKRGNSEAFALLAAKYDRLAHFVALSFTGSKEDARDIVQDALLTALQNQGELRQNKAFGSWYLTIVRNRALNWRRQWTNRNSNRTLDQVKRSDRVIAAEALSASDSLRARRDVRSAVRLLPAELIPVVVLRFWMGLTCCQVAVALGVSESTVKRRLRKSIALLRKYLG